MWILMAAADPPPPAAAPPAFQVVAPTIPPIRMSPATDDSDEVGGITVVAPKAVPKWAKEYNFDPEGVFAKEKQPYLAKRPHDGCKPVVDVDVGPMGLESPAGRIVCAIPFW